MDFNVNEAYRKELLKNFKEQIFVSELEYILVKSKKIYISEKTLAQTADFSYEGIGITEILDCSLIDLVANYFNKGETTRNFLFNVIEYKIEKNQFNRDDLIYIYKICRLHNINLSTDLPKNNLVYELIPLFEKICGKIINKNEDSNFFTIENGKIEYIVYLTNLVFSNKIKIVELFKIMFDYCDVDSFRALSYFYIEKYYTKFLDQHHGNVSFFDVSFPIDQIDIYSAFHKTIAALDLIYGVFFNHPKLRVPTDIYFKYKTNLFTEKEISVLEEIASKIHSLSVLDDMMINFYIIAEQMLEDLQYTPLVDYSSCSLQYYKIIELLLKRHLFVRNYKDCDASQIYKDIAPWMNLNPLKYNRDWLNTVTLEKIYHFVDRFLLLKKELENNKRALASYSSETRTFFKELDENFPMNNTFEFIKKVLHRKVLNTYRNPPAHSHPCTRETAEEAKKILFDLLHRLTEENFYGKYDETGKFTVYTIDENVFFKTYTNAKTVFDIFAYGSIKKKSDDILDKIIQNKW